MPQTIATVQFRDAGVVYLENVERPTFIYDNKTFSRLKYGDYAQTLKAYKQMCKVYRDTGFDYMADDLSLVEVPPNQDLVDQLFQISEVFEKFVKNLPKED